MKRWGPTTIETQFYNLRESHNIEFNFSYLSNIDSDKLLYFIAAFGSEQNYQQFIEDLPSVRSSVDCEDYHHRALYIAFKYGSIKLITYFLKSLKLYEDDLAGALRLLGFAAEFGYVCIVRDIMKNYQCDPAFQNNYAIRWSASDGHLEVIKYLMSLDSKYGMDPAANDTTCGEIFNGRSACNIYS